MTQPSGTARRKPIRERKRHNGKFAPDPDKEAEPYAIRHTTNYRRLRNAAMRLLKHLEHMMPPPETEQTAAPTDAEEAETHVIEAEDSAPAEPNGDDEVQAEQNDSEQKAKKLDPAYERLLGRGDGIINGFNTLALLVMRLIEKERESRASAKAKATAPPPQIDETELDRQILEELDLIAQARGSEEDLQKAS